MTKAIKQAIAFARFVLDANTRLNDARAVANGDKEMLAEELNDIAKQAEKLLAAFADPDAE